MPGFAPIYPDTRAPVLVGRDAELATAVATMRNLATRLLTITGPAGVGKTRFAVELGRLIADDYADGAIVIDLTTISEPEALDGELARVVGLRGVDGQLELDDWLRNHQVLLVLDNAEHVLDIGPRVARWLALSEGSRAIVTSRHRLNVSVETELYLDTLPVASGSRSTIPRPVAGASPAARLFLQVVGIDDDHQIDPITLAQVERICDRLDGLPLALELVGARLPAITSDHLADVLEHNIDAHGLGEIAGMQPAFESAVDWSYRLLSPQARQLLRYLTVYVGGFSLELAERQAAHARLLNLDRSAIADCLEELSDHHMILPMEDARVDVPRFRMLAMVSDTARHWLVEHGEEEDARESHARALISYAEQRQHSGLRPRLEFQVAELAENLHNLIAGLTWLSSRDDGEALLQLNGALAWFWYAHGYYGDGQAWYERTLQHDFERKGLHWARFLLGYGLLLDVQAHFERAHELLTEALEVYQELDDPFGITTSSLVLGLSSFHLERNDEAERHLQRSIEHASRVPQTDLAQALEGLAWENLGANAHELGALAEAEDAVRHAVDIQQRVEFRWGISRAMCDLGNILRDRNELRGALEAHKAALVPARVLQDSRLIAANLAGIATVLALDGQPMQTAWFWGAVDALRPMAGPPSYLKANLRAYERGRRIAQDQLGAKVLESTHRIGSRTALEEVLALASEISLRGGRALTIPTAVQQELTEREREVLELLVHGASTHSIGAVLGITERTVSSHIGSLFRKLGVNSRLELIALVVQAQ